MIIEMEHDPERLLQECFLLYTVIQTVVMNMS